MIDEQFLQTIPQYGIGGFVGKIFKKVKDTVKKVAPIAGAGIGFLLGGSAGAGIGAGIGGLIAGQKPGEALGTAALGYGLGSLAGSFAPIGRYAGRGIPGTSIPGIFSGQELAAGANVKDPANILQRLISGGGGAEGQAGTANTGGGSGGGGPSSSARSGSGGSGIVVLRYRFQSD